MQSRGVEQLTWQPSHVGSSITEFNRRAVKSQYTAIHGGNLNKIGGLNRGTNNKGKKAKVYIKYIKKQVLKM